MANIKLSGQNGELINDWMLKKQEENQRNGLAWYFEIVGRDRPTDGARDTASTEG
jgi:hypothetical protein